MTKELDRKVEKIEVRYTISRLEGMQRAERNYLEIDIRQYGNKDNMVTLQRF